MGSQRGGVEANAGNHPYDALTGRVIRLGMAPPDGILPSTKPHHDAWTEYGRQQSVLGFWSRVEPNEAGCWIWTGTRDRRNYGRWSSPYWNGVHAHRLAWEMLRGMPAPRSSGLELDHLCHNDDLSCYGGDACPHRPCVNPDHLAEVSIAQNRETRRRRLTTECRHGHPMSGSNLYVNPNTGQRTCRTCVREATERWLDKGNNRERQNAMRNQRRAS